MTRQADFWKPKPYDFEEIVAGVNIERLTIAYVKGAGAHAYNAMIGSQALWSVMESYYDLYDRAHFESTDVAPETDVWDNRKKRASA